jgi:hypothetical protein
MDLETCRGIAVRDVVGASEVRVDRWGKSSDKRREDHREQSEASTSEPAKEN